MYPFNQYPFSSNDAYDVDFNAYGGYDDRIFGPGFPSFGSPPFGPPSGPPSSLPQGGPSFGPPGQTHQDGPPQGPPPSYVPSQTFGAETFAVDPGAIRRCMRRYTYIWLRNGQQFWFFPTFIGRTSVSGWRWTGFRWIFFGTSLRQIQSFTCV